MMWIARSGRSPAKRQVVMLVCATLFALGAPVQGGAEPSSSDRVSYLVVHGRGYVANEDDPRTTRTMLIVAGAEGVGLESEGGARSGGWFEILLGTRVYKGRPASLQQASDGDVRLTARIGELGDVDLVFDAWGSEGLLFSSGMSAAWEEQGVDGSWEVRVESSRVRRAFLSGQVGGRAILAVEDNDEDPFAFVSTLARTSVVHHRT